MITILARFKMQPDKEDEALAAVRKMAEAVEANEPGALVYVMHRCVAQPSEIIVFEVYKDEPAFEAHRRTPHIEELTARFSHLMDPASFKVERLDRIAGFVR
jgi:quinol monooxygenase YgiN